jgi:hypothetical protein
VFVAENSRNGEEDEDEDLKMLPKMIG